MENFNKYYQYFMPHIFQRGEDIAETNAVKILENNGKYISAKVKGSKTYDVEINLGRNWYMFCTCPYAEKGQYCKHMAAVLITAENLVREKELKDNSHIRIIKKDVNKKEIISDFRKICRHYLGRDGFIDYRKAHYFFRELYLFTEELQDILSSGFAVECAGIIAAVTLGFDEIPVDDSDGGKHEFYSSILDIAEKILELNNPEADKIIYDWMEKVNGDSDSWYLQECIYPLWCGQFSEEELEDREIELLEKKVSAYIAEGADENNYSFIYTLMELVRLKEQRGDDYQQITALIEPYKKSSSITDYLIEKAGQKGDLEEEENLIKYGLHNGKILNYFGTISRYKEKLCDFYKRSGRNDEYMELLRELVINNYNSIERFMEYKTCFNPEDWKKEVADIIDTLESKVKHGNIIAKIFVEENMQDKLYEWLKKIKSLEETRHYKQYLGDDYKEKIICVFSDALDRFAAPAGNREHYDRVVEWMKYISELDGGKELISEKVREYLEKYKRRPNFMKALDSMK